MRRVAAFVFFTTLAATSSAQPIASSANPIAASLRELGTKGLQPAANSSAPALNFAPKNSGRTIQAVVDLIATNAEDRKTFREGLDALIKAFEESQTGSNKFDVAGAVAFNLVVLNAIANQVEPAEATINKVRDQLRSSFRADPRALDTNDLARQEIYETHLAVASLMLILASVTEDEAGAKSLAATSKAFLSAFLGTTAFNFGTDGLRITARPKPPAQAPQSVPANPLGGLAPGFSAGIPNGWEKVGDWYRRSSSERSIVRALVRFPAAIPVSGGVGQELDRQWEKLRPEGKIDLADRNYYARYVGGAPAYYRIGRVQEEHLQAPTFVAVTLVRVGDLWQPIVLAVTYGDPPPPYEPGAAFSASYEYPSGAALAEEIIGQIKVQGANRPNLFPAADLVGDFSTSSGMSGAVVNMATGATGMGYSASGMSLNLKADGTFTSKVTNVVGGPGAFGSQTGSDAGRWTIEGDKLILNGREKDQYTIVGLTLYTDAKVLLLDWDTKRPAHPGNLGMATVLVAPR